MREDCSEKNEHESKLNEVCQHIQAQRGGYATFYGSGCDRSYTIIWYGRTSRAERIISWEDLRNSGSESLANDVVLAEMPC